MKDITQEMHGLSGRSSPCTRPSSAKSSQDLAETGGSCQTGSSRIRSVTKQASGNDSESGLKTQSDTEMRSETDPDNTQTGSQTDSGHPDSLSHTSSKHSHSSDHVQDEVTSTIRGTATAICVQSAPPLQWSEVIALGYIPEDWLPPKLPRREQIVESQCSRLQLLHHAFHCSESQETCHIGRGCLATKHLWQHILACDSVNCDPRCVSSKQLVMHHQTCQCPACPICVPVRANVAEERRLASKIQQMQQEQQQEQEQQVQQASSSHDSC
ncbi:TPA: hypothetical protein ACH3X3_006520 [Trebouxia sp. C0006]